MTDVPSPSVCSIRRGPHELKIGYTDIGAGRLHVYLHGWGVHCGFWTPIYDQLSGAGRHVLLDFPGFGASTPPPEPWGTTEYAECLHDFLTSLDLPPAVLITHSFGGRVAVRLAAKHPERVAAIVFIASAGLRRRVPFLKRLRVKSIQTLARAARACLPAAWGEPVKKKLYSFIASRDYLNAGPMRDTFVKVVNEDLAPLLPSISAPCLLLWGSDDMETPPELGRRMSELLPDAEYIELPGFDHYSILDRGRHQTAHQIARFLKGRFQ
ncbi:MAG: alpha/beta fold hydrolase [bacterium]|nr:alpha/beta fold hydrolase [bacterium]